MASHPLIDLLTQPWAIIPEKLIEIHAIYAAHLRGERADIAAIEAASGKALQNDPQGYTVEDGVAVVPLTGVLAKRANLFQAISGGASHQLFARDVNAALADPKVNAILIEADSPGGSADGTQLAAQAVAAARGVKPIVTLADGTMASAAYWIGAYADSVYAVDSGTQVGSIGVAVAHVDISRAEQMMGRKTTEIYAGQYKRIASAYAPLTEPGRATLQDMVDTLYGIFVQAVATARGASVERVLADMADGRMFIGQQAVDAGLVDGIATRDQALADLRSRVASQGRVITLAPARRTPAALLFAADPQRRRTAAEPKDSPMARAEVTIDVNMALDAQASVLAAEYPDIAAELRRQGAAAERQRVADVRAQSLPGHEALIEQLVADGKTSGPEAAVAVLQAERALSAQRLADIAADAPKPLPADASALAADPAAGDGGKPKAAADDPRAKATALAAAIAAKQAAAQQAGRPISATHALALVHQE